MTERLQLLRWLYRIVDPADNRQFARPVCFNANAYTEPQTPEKIRQQPTALSVTKYGEYSNSRQPHVRAPTGSLPTGCEKTSLWGIYLKHDDHRVGVLS